MNTLFLTDIQGLVWDFNMYIYYFFSNSDVMESIYKMVNLLVDNLIQGQLIVSPGKKRQTAAKFAV